MLKVSICGVLIIWIFSAKCLNVSSEDDSRCESPWEQIHHSCIQLMNVKNTWQDARESCLSINSDLLSINSEFEDENVSHIVNRFGNNSTDFHKWWIGIRLVNSTWKWVDNEKIYAGVPVWAPPAEMNVTLSEKRCGVLDYQGYLLHRPCGSQRYYICEQNKSTDQPLSHTVTVTPLPTKITATKTTGTPYPIPTPHTVTPNTRPPATKPTEKTTGKTDSWHPSSTRHSTVRPTEVTTDDTITGYPTNESTEYSTKQSTDRSTEMYTRISTETHISTEIQSTETHTETTTHGLISDKPTESSTSIQSTSHKTGRPTTRPTRRPSTGQPTHVQETTTENPKEETDKFLGCFAVNYESTCPPVEAFGISWPRSKPGTVTVQCNKGQAKWKCDKNPTCWRDEPDLKQCTSENIQELTTQMEEFLSNTSNSEKAVEFTENLAFAVESDDTMSQQDILQSTKLMEAAANAEPKNSSEAKNIIKNVVKCGSSLVEKKETWGTMNKESQRTVASALLNSMESVTNKMLDSFDEPTVETIKEENMAIELQVIDINKDGSEANDTTFQTESNSFVVPQENLRRFSKGGIARLVFINYNIVGEFLIPADDAANDSFERQMISQVISASLNEKPVAEPLVQPVLFTMKTEKVVGNQGQKPLCSFWNFSLGYTGAWSQEGCLLKQNNDTHTTCQCDHLTNFAILMDVHSIKITRVHAITLSYITYVGIIISTICLFLSWITFVFLSIRCIRGSWSSSGNGEAKEYYGASGSYTGPTAGSRSTQGERNSIHKHLAFCLFIAEVLFLTGIERTDNKVACAVIAGFLHYFFLSSFTWMFIEGIHIVLMLVQVFDAARSRLKYYYLIAYGAPVLIIAISSLVYYEGYGTEKYCWLTSDRMFIWSFAGPVAFILLVNLAILVYAMRAVYKHSEYVFTKDKSMVANFKAWIQGALAMEVLLGLTWVFGYFYISEGAIPVAYLFTIFNSLQGLFIFVFHCLMNKKVRKAYVRFIDYPRRTVSSGTHSTKANSHSHSHSGSGPTTATYHMKGTRKHSRFLDLRKNRRPSSMSTTSA